LGDQTIRNFEGPRAPYSSLLFVYGTLRRGFCRHKYLKSLGARLLAGGKVGGVLFDLGAYPGAIPASEPASFVTGEVYQIRNPGLAWKVLDEAEGTGAISPESGLYRREAVEVQLAHGEIVDAWIYWLNRVHIPKRRIASGDYTRRAR